MPLTAEERTAMLTVRLAPITELEARVTAMTPSRERTAGLETIEAAKAEVTRTNTTLEPPEQIRSAFTGG